ncbi:MAG TPA: glycosyltransferase, partial [Thermoanaerobaculia bacterium]|nr:glycosyltransferase [Thermoanaerobaculia bacterium]
EGREPSRSYALVVAALAPYKRVDEAIAACVRLGLPLTIVGTGPEEARLRSGAGPSVRFLGRVPDAELRELYRHAACLLQPGVEDFGIAPVEALACGTPVVALGRGGVLDIVADGRHGVLYPGEGSVPALAAAIDKGRQIRFNANDLRAHAESFSKMSFLERFGRILEQHLPAAEGARAGRVSP